MILIQGWSKLYIRVNDFAFRKKHIKYQTVNLYLYKYLTYHREPSIDTDAEFQVLDEMPPMSWNK